MLKWLPILPFAGFLALMSCAQKDPVDAAVVETHSATTSIG